jgi:hypothetical protein
VIRSAEVSPGGTIEVGDTVVVRFGPRTLLAEVLEDRGRLGANGDRILRVGWTPGETNERFEAEVSESAVIRAHPQHERARALARIDEWSVRAPMLGSASESALARVHSSRMLVDKAVRAAAGRGEPKDFELVHRRCVENLGPAALHTRRLWTEVTSVPHVNPTLNRLPAMIEEAGVSTEWPNAPDPVEVWHGLLVGQVEGLLELEFADAPVGGMLIRVVGYCADMAAWIRMTHRVGD